MTIEIQVPNTLNDITLGQYQKFLKISKDQEDSLFLNQKMVEIFCNVELKQVLNIKYKSLEKIIKHLSTLFEQKPKFINSFIKNDINFSFIPHLDDMTFGEYVDLDSTLKELTKKTFFIEVEKKKYEAVLEKKMLHDPENKIIKS